MAQNALATYLKDQLSKQPQKGRPPLPQLAKRGLVWLLVVMAALSALSQAASLALTARVTISRPGGGTLDKSVSGTGAWAAGETLRVRAEQAGLRVGEVFQKVGDLVEAGDPLFSYDLTSIEEAEETLKTEIARLNLQIKGLNTGEADTAQSAAFSLQNAQEDMALAQERLYRAEQQASQTEAEAQRAYQAAQAAYDALAAQAEAALAPLRQAVADAQAALDPANPATQDALNGAQAALAQGESQWNTQLAGAKDALAAAQSQWQAAQGGQDLSGYEDGITAAQRAFRAAQFSYEQALEADADARKQTGYQVADIKLTRDQAQAKLDALRELADAEGLVRAGAAGTVTAMPLSPGQSVSGEEVVSIATGALAFEAQVEAGKAEALAPGDQVELSPEGGGRPPLLSLSRIGPPDAEGKVALLCEGQEGAGANRVLGRKEAFTVKKLSPRYDTCVPIAALRQDGAGQTYVLCLGSQDTVLGPVTVARRVDVTILERDSQKAAVDGPLAQEDQLIVSSSKPIQDGDRVVASDG